MTTLYLRTPYMAGITVTHCQRALVARGAHIAVDGSYGPQTWRAVRVYQATHGLAVDGVVGSLTWRSLGVKAKPVPASKWTPAKVALYTQVHFRGRMTYTEQMNLRMWGVTHHVKAGGNPLYADCTAFCTWCYYAAGEPDPN